MSCFGLIQNPSVLSYLQQRQCSPIHPFVVYNPTTIVASGETYHIFPNDNGKSLIHVGYMY
jgi:hypothetical protein